MWQEENTWLHYVKNIIAADIHSAIFLAAYLRQSGFSRHYLNAVEIIDVNRYKVVKKHHKIKAMLQHYPSKPFVFLVGKN